MANQTHHSPARRHTIRDLRAGNGLAGPIESEEPSTGPRAGRVGDRDGFVHGLEQTIAQAASLGDRVFVFRLTGSVKGLQRWNSNDGIPADAVHRAVEAAILSENPGLSLWRSENDDLVGFDIAARPPAIAERLGGRLMTALAKPLGADGHQFIFSPQLGVCVFDPEYRTGIEAAEAAIEAAGETLAQTDFAAPFLVHNRYIAERSARWKRIAADMPSAMADGSITVAFQPRLAADRWTVAGLEVLARWYRPDRGPVPPSEFLAVAEREGSLVDIGRWLRAHTIELVHGWSPSGTTTWSPHPRRLWFNIGALELCHPEVVGSITELVDGDDSLPVGLEVPDSRLLEDLIFLRIFDRLREAGVELALDNVKPSSLSFGRLARLPVAMLNLDGELVRNLPSSAENRDLIRLLCSNAVEQGVTVTACGIETDEQLRIAKACGVDLVQGIGIAAVRRSEDTARYLAGEGDDRLRAGRPGVDQPGQDEPHVGRSGATAGRPEEPVSRSRAQRRP